MLAVGENNGDNCLPLDLHFQWNVN